jgi:heptosyltransferase-2
MLLTDRVPVVESGFNARRDPCIDSYLRLAKRLGCAVDDRRMELVATSADRQAADALWRDIGFSADCPTVLLNTGAATADTKRWPNEHAAQAALELSRTHGLQVLLHCGPAERELANAIEVQVSDPNVRSMGRARDLPLGLSKGVIEKSDVVISTDSGPRHIAVALNKPVVSLFGPISPALTQTYNVAESVVTMGLDCQPCGKYACPLKHTNCMKALDAQRVVRAALQRMQCIPGGTTFRSNSLNRIDAAS